MSTLSGLESRGNYVIASPQNISLNPGQVHRAARKQRDGGLAALALRCRNYLAWHPAAGGLFLISATAMLISGLTILNTAIMPVVNGWAICTPQNGVVLALLLMTRRRHWPWILLGYAVALSQGSRIVPSLPHLSGLQVFGNLVELCLAAFTLPPFRNLKQWVQERRLMPAFLAYAIVLGPLLMSFSVASRMLGTSTFWPRAGTVALAEALGVTLATSLVLVLLNRETYALFRPRSLPQFFALTALAAGGAWLTTPAASSLFLLAPVAVLAILAFRCGVRAAVLGTSISVAAAVFSTIHFHTAPATAQTFLALALLTVFPLSVVLTNKHFLEDRLHDAHSELDRLKSLDRLTGVPNRKRFDLVLDREWQRATRDPKPVALLMVDVDDVDLYTQHYGPEAADECLRRVAARMSDQPHRAYDLVSRYEGGKFTVLLPGASGTAVKRIAEEFRAEIAAQEWPHVASPFERVTVSIGWASMIPLPQSRPDALIVAADAALNLARDKGKNRIEGIDESVDVPAPAVASM